MTRIGHQNLNSGNLTGTIRYQDGTIEYLVMYNNNPVPLYVRLGSPEIPTQRNYDIAVPPMYIMAISVNSNQFGFRLGDDNLITSLLIGNTVIEGMVNEAPPALGGVPIQAASLATADLTNGFQSYNTATNAIIGPFNLSLWGGCNLFVLPQNTSGQGVVTIQVSSDSTSWQTYGTWALLPGIPASFIVPRISVWIRFILNTTAIAGEPNITGVYDVRAALDQVLQPAFNAGGNNYSKNFSFAALGSQTFYYVTAGLPAIILRMNVASGVRQEMVWYTGPTASGPWSLASFREQSVAGFYNSIYRSIGSLDNYLRVDILDIGNNAGSGTIAVSVPGGADLTSMLQNIYSALGDVGQPVNTNQSIYHELDSIRILTNTMNTGINTLHTDLVSVNSNLGSINTTDAAILAKLTGTTSGVFFNQAMPAAGVFVNTGIDMTAGGVAVACTASMTPSGATASPTSFGIGYGTAGAVVGLFAFFYLNPSTALGMLIGPVIKIDSVKTPGFNYGGNTRVWLQQFAQATAGASASVSIWTAS